MISLKTEKVTYSLIEAAVNRGIKEMQEDPKRSVRKLADLGNQFARGRFQKSFFELSQTLLQDDDCPYYTLLSRLTEEIDHETLKRFGVNLGYTSWTYGAQLIRAYENEHGFEVPWTIFFHYHPQASFTLSHMDSLIREGRSIGIFTYFLRLETIPDDWSALTELFCRYENSAFLLFLPDEELNEDAAGILSECHNVLISAELSTCYKKNISLLKQKSCLTANHHYYLETDDETLSSQLKGCESPFLFLLAQNGCSPADQEQLAESVYQLRCHPKYPVFPMELFTDHKRIDHIISGKTCFMEIKSDGTFSLPDGSLLSVLEPEASLPSLLREITLTASCETCS